MSPLREHTFLVPPFFVTTGVHYMHNMPISGYNVLHGVRSNVLCPDAFFNLICTCFSSTDGGTVPVHVFLNTRRFGIVRYDRPTPTAVDYMYELVVCKWVVDRILILYNGSILNVLLELTLSIYTFLLFIYFVPNLVQCLLFYLLLVFVV